MSLKIGFFARDFLPQISGGIDTSFFHSVRALATYHPHNQYFIITSEGNFEILQHAFHGVSVTCVPIAKQPKSRLMRLYRRLSKQPDYLTEQLESLGLDVIFYPRQMVIAKPASLPAVLRLYDIQHEYYPEFFSIGLLERRQKNYRNALARADVIAVSTDHTLHTVQEKMPEYAHKAMRVYPGASIEHAIVPQEKRQEVLTRYQLPERFIFYPANAWLHKNHARLFAALRHLRDSEGLAIPLVCTGRLATEAPYVLKNFAVAAGAETLVHDLGYIPDEDLPAVYQSAEMLVFPSLFEGFGYPIMEAMRNQCPVVCARATCLPEVAGEAALYFDPFDIVDIASAIKQVWQDDELKEVLRQKGQLNIQRFSWQAYADAMQSLFEQTIQNRT